MDYSKERAVEITAHMVAAGVHHALALNRITTAEMKEVISSDFDPALIDLLLAGIDNEKIGLRFMAAVAHFLKFDWQMQIRPLPEPPAKKMEEAA